MRKARGTPALLLLSLLLGLAGTTTVARANPLPRDPLEALRHGLAADTDSVVARDSARRDSTLGPIQEARPDTLEADSAAVRDSAVANVEALRQALSSGDFPQRDDLFQELLDLPGFQAVEYRGRSVELDIQEEIVSLKGEAQANYAESVLQADSILYAAGIQFVWAWRDIVLNSEGREVRSDEILRYDVAGFKGTIVDARTSFSEMGAKWFVRGDATPRGQRTVFVETGSFTSCEFEQPHYYFRAGQIKVVTESVIVAWPVTFFVQGVPIAWLPFFAQDIRKGRRSGFLPPRFGFNDIIGGESFRRQVSDFGYYWAINPFLDAQATIDWFSGEFTRVNGAFRYRLLKKFVQGNLLASYSFGNRGSTLDFRVNHDQDLSPATSFKVRANFIQNTRTFQDQSFDPRQQTGTIDSDLGFNHRFPFASLSISARRRQGLGTQTGRTDLTLPQLNLNFSPVTLFPAPRGQGGLFNNMVLSGSVNFSRQSVDFEAKDDQVTTSGRGSLNFRVGALNLSGTGNALDRRTIPFDSLGLADPAFRQTTADWGAAASYQLNLIGSTTLRPRIGINGGYFRSPDTGDDFVGTPTRFNLGASLSTDVFGFIPGFGPFTGIRHKITPIFNYEYSPEVIADDSLLAIPGFPSGAAAKRHTLSIKLNQTFEAKLRPEVRERVEQEEMVPDSTVPGLPVGDPGAGGVEADSAAVADAVLPGSPQVPPDSARARGQPRVATGSGRRPPEDKPVVLLAINSGSLLFDFTKEDEPLLVTDRWQHQISSDLLRGLALNMTLDLFEGTGKERNLAPIVSVLNASFTFSSSRGLAGLFGLGRQRPLQPVSDPAMRINQGVDSRYRLGSFDQRIQSEREEFGEAGPWSLSLGYSLQRVREEDPGEGRQSITATFSLRPTPQWRFQWRTQYSLKEKEFGEHLVTLDRDLHRWQASFVFSRSPNGNFLFQVRVNLRDAPDLKLDYDQQTLNR